MQTIISIVCLALLLWVEPVSAQQLYSLKVSIHKDVPQLTKDQIDEALERASRLLKEPGNQCNVTLKRNGPVETFEFDSAPKNIRNLDDLEAVHRVPADIKIVESIHFCMGRYDKAAWWGCAWRPEGSLQKTVIVVRGVRPGPVVGRDTRYLLWAHEFAHTKSLHHRIDDRALMTACAIGPLTRRITNDECTCLKDGPEGCPIQAPQQEATCSARGQ